MITVYGVEMSKGVSEYLDTALSGMATLGEANRRLHEVCGVVEFFDSAEELEIVQQSLSARQAAVVSEEPRRAYGDYQTAIDLAVRVAERVDIAQLPSFMLEPTCGKGNFILAALQRFESLRQIIAIEIYKPYIWEAKCSILEVHLQGKALSKPDIVFRHESIFDVDLGEIAADYPDDPVLVLGNPPWVTNAELATLASDNLPKKSNFKRERGIDAITGKGNFDIGEYITLSLLKAFHHGRSCQLSRCAEAKRDGRDSHL